MGKEKVREAAKANNLENFILFIIHQLCEDLFIAFHFSQTSCPTFLLATFIIVFLRADAGKPVHRADVAGGVIPGQAKPYQREPCMAGITQRLRRMRPGDGLPRARQLESNA